jgi:hypothetical protein
LSLFIQISQKNQTTRRKEEQKQMFERGSSYYNMKKKELRWKLYSTVMTQQPFAFKKKQKKITNRKTLK